MLSDNFKEILDQYPIEKKKNIKGNAFAFKMRKGFTNDLKGFLEPMLDIDKYKIKISHGQGSWVEKPWAGITKYNSFQDGLNIGFTFFPEEKFVTLHIVQGRNKISNSTFNERNKVLIEIINKEKDLIAKLGRHNFTMGTPLNTEDSGAIIEKYYEYDELNDTDLKKDLEVVLEVYQKLISKYEEMMGKKTEGHNLISILKNTSNISNNPNLHDGSYELVSKTVEFISKLNPSKLTIRDMDLLYLMTVGTFRCGWDCKVRRIENSNLKEDDKKSLIQILNSVKGKLENGEYNNSQDHVGMFGTGFMTFKGKMNEDDARKFLTFCVVLQKSDDDESMFKEAEKVLNGGIKGLGVGTVSQILHCLKPFTFPIINGAMNKGTTIYDELGVELKKPVLESNYIENSKRIKKFKDKNYGFVKNYRAIDLLNFINDLNNSRNFWLLSPGENAAYWDEFRKNNIISIGWGNLGDLAQYGGDKDKILNALEREYPKKSETYNASNSNKSSKQTNNAKALLDFSKEMKIGDIVFIKKGTNTLLGVGILTSDYEFSKESKIPSEIIKTDHNHFRDVKWLKCGEFDVSVVGPMPLKTLTNITNYPSNAFEGLFYYQALAKLMDFPIDEYLNHPPEEDKSKDIRYSKEDFLQDVIFLEENYNQLVNLIKRKKNIILQGPPGVGKSFIATRLAYSIMGCKDESRVEFIQFHQSYSYEDFIQGFRPVKDGFNLKNGVFYNFCRKAQDDPNNDYYFIIDEINRGNISKIFGELMMLIEDDKRGEEFAIHLTYSDEGEPKFFIPSNVYVIGMMNTADRSLAMIDYALRRRFVFYSVDPLFEEENLFKSYLINIGLEEKLATKIISRFKTLNEKIIDDDSLGDGFKIGHSYFCAGNITDDYGSKNYEDWYSSIINYEIAPLLKEYWFDNIETAQEEIDKLIN